MVIDCDTTTDVMHKEPLSICMRIADDVGDCSEHLLSCQSASGTSAVAFNNTIVTAYKTRLALQVDITAFCAVYQLDTFSADEIALKDEEYGDVKVCNAKEDSTDNFPLNKISVEKKDVKKIPSFIVALKYLSYPEFHLIDAYPTLCQVFAIAVAIPISSTSTEPSFSALKRV